ncbi:O-antigen/teichoic acid export membrane protein [Methanomicrobium sp. W14]|nr:O-antigen/teichoic acid export membrane protein [Methanomicrobium sp. W14]
MDYFFLIPLAVFINGLYLALRYWNTRRIRFGTQASTQALQSVSGSGMKVGLGTLGFINPGSLIASQIIGNGLGTLILLIQAIRCDFSLLRSSVSISCIFRQLKRYKKFPIFNIWGAFLNSISWQIPIFMFTAFFSSTVTGLYALGMTVIQMPMSLIGSSISQVFLQRASSGRHNNTLSELARDTTSVLIILTVMPFTLLSLLGGDIFGLIFGPQWVEAGVYVQILGLWAMVWFVVSPLTTISIVVEKQEINLIYNIILVITRFASLFIGGICGSVYIALFLFMLTGAIVYFGIGYICVIVWAKASIKEIRRQVQIPVIIAICLALLILFLSYLPITTLGICVIAVVIFFIYMCYIFKTQPLIGEYIGKR